MLYLFSNRSHIKVEKIFHWLLKVSNDSLRYIVCAYAIHSLITDTIATLQIFPATFDVPCGVSAFVLVPGLLIRSLLLCRDKDGVDVVEERPWTSLLMFEDSLALLDRLYRLSIFRERLKRQKRSMFRGSTNRDRRELSLIYSWLSTWRKVAYLRDKRRVRKIRYCSLNECHLAIVKWISIITRSYTAFQMLIYRDCLLSQSLSVWYFVVLRSSKFSPYKLDMQFVVSREQ